jgi:hypothetical protein
MGRSLSRRSWTSTSVLAAFLLLSEIQHAAQAEDVSIVGAYRLIERTLADGTIQTPPDIEGLLTYTEKYKNFNAIWKDPEGKLFSFSAVAEYALTGTEYTETLLFSIFNQISDNKTIYDQAGGTKSGVVKVSDEQIYVELPFDPITEVFEGNKLTATGPDFIDVWEKME